MQNPTIAFIGAGNMATAIIGGLVSNGFDNKKIWASAPSTKNLAPLQTEHAINISTDNIAAIEQADIVVLGVKPQQMQNVCTAIQASVQIKKPLIISIAAGITCSMLENWLGAETSIVRCMPNTPSLVQTGASGLYANKYCQKQQQEFADFLLTSIGIVSWVETENLIDAVTAVSGSGPAYFFLVMEAMQAAGEALGLDAKTAKDLTLQTALGAAKMAMASDVSAADLRRRVTSPGGTTAAALAVLTGQGLPETFKDALTAADERSKSLAKEMQ